HAAVMVYPRLEGLSTELQRFYALGIDSCRIAGELIGGQQTINLDGVTGRLSYRGGNTLQREPIQAVFRDGVGVSLENAEVKARCRRDECRRSCRENRGGLFAAQVTVSGHNRLPLQLG